MSAISIDIYLSIEIAARELLMNDVNMHDVSKT